MFERLPWVQGGEECDSPLFRLDFCAKAIESARIAICGLGYFELYVNGRRVGEDLFVPAFSDYEPRRDRRMTYPIHDRFSHRTYYLTYDLLSYLREGENCLGVRLGNGWYNQTLRTAEGDFAYGRPRLAFLLTLADPGGKETTYDAGSGLLWRESEIVFNNLFYGEKHDLRLCCDDFSLPGSQKGEWKPVLPSAAPDSAFYEQDCPTDKITRRLKAEPVFSDGEKALYDCGENISGFVVLRVLAGEGEKVTVRHAELLNPTRDGLDFSTAGGEEQIQADEYRSDGKGRLCHPRFCWHGFRYFEVVGEAQVESVAVVHADIAVTASFSSSNPVLNWLFEAYVRTQLANMHGGIPSDCPHRERLGYTGDGQLTIDASLLCLDAEKFYVKWMADIAGCQDREGGHVQHTAPFMGGGGGPGGWGSAVVHVPYAFYRRTGELSLAGKYHSNMLAWLDYMESRIEEGLVVREEKGGWCLGDWCTPEYPAPPLIPEPFVNTFFYLRSIDEFLELASRTGLLDEETRVRLICRREKSAKAMRERYRDGESGSFCGGVNGADAFALTVGIGDERTERAFVEKYRNHPCLDTGIFGTDLVIDRLFALGEASLAFTLLTAETPSSFARMKNAGATTIWETWDGGASHNHPMFGGVVRSLFTHILGIRSGEAGYERISVEPADIPELAWAKGSIMGPRGPIEVSYARDAGGNRIVTA